MHIFQKDSACIVDATREFHLTGTFLKLDNNDSSIEKLTDDLGHVFFSSNSLHTAVILSIMSVEN